MKDFKVVPIGSDDGKLYMRAIVENFLKEVEAGNVRQVALIWESGDRKAQASKWSNSMFALTGLIDVIRVAMIREWLE